LIRKNLNVFDKKKSDEILNQIFLEFGLCKNIVSVDSIFVSQTVFLKIFEVGTFHSFKESKWIFRTGLLDTHTFGVESLDTWP
jgi:hypothetical protein